jgi:hypothetical protein
MSQIKKAKSGSPSIVDWKEDVSDLGRDIGPAPIVYANDYYIIYKIDHSSSTDRQLNG